MLYQNKLSIEMMKIHLRVCRKNDRILTQLTLEEKIGKNIEIHKLGA
jgi:hypothetical protein